MVTGGKRLGLRSQKSKTRLLELWRRKIFVICSSRWQVLRTRVVVTVVSSNVGDRASIVAGQLTHTFFRLLLLLLRLLLSAIPSIDITCGAGRQRCGRRHRDVPLRHLN